MEPLSSDRVSFLVTAARSYATNLDSAKEFLQARGLLRGTAERFQLGVVAEPMAGHEMYVGRLAIPYSLYDGSVVSIRYRCLGIHDCKAEGHPKYLTETGDDARLYNTPALFTAGEEIHVTEGELDSVTLSQTGQSAVGFPGVSSVKPHHLRLLNGFSRIYVWGDGDDAGREFVARIRRTHRRAVGARLPEGEDVTSLFVKEGADGLRRAIGLETHEAV